MIFFIYLLLNFQWLAKRIHPNNDKLKNRFHLHIWFGQQLDFMQKHVHLNAAILTSIMRE